MGSAVACMTTAVSFATICFLSPDWIREMQAANLHLCGCPAQPQVGLALLYTLEGGLDVGGRLVTCS